MLIYETGNARWSQEQFAARFRTSLDVLQNWEQHRNEPDPIARNVLEMIKRNPVAAEWPQSGRCGVRNLGNRVNVQEARFRTEVSEMQATKGH
jgi:ribosome-binding protein aMBF1 (putative translation factor)